ncbi:unnamed protein product, partial [Effrenium voratum]
MLGLRGLLPLLSLWACLAEPDASLVANDDSCSSEEGDCSLSLRQLRLHKAAKEAEAAAVEEEVPEPVSYALPCTEPSELSMEEVNAMEEEQSNQSESCITSNVYWRE